MAKGGLTPYNDTTWQKDNRLRMTRHLYFGTVSRSFLKDAVQYGAYPLARLLGSLMFQERHRSEAFANLVVGLAYVGITTDYLGKESQVLDSIGKDIVSAELGIPLESFEPHHYGRSKNSIVHREWSDLGKVNLWRGVATLSSFITAVCFGIFGRNAPGMGSNPEDKIQNADPTVGSGFLDRLRRGVSDLNIGNFIYMGQALYWGWETFSLPKSGMYEAVKILETIQSSQKDIKPDDIWVLLQRTRESQKKPVYTLEMKDAFRPLLKHMADNYNASEKPVPFGLSELVYLIGFDKIRACDETGKFSPALVDQSMAEIDRMAEIGLQGIRAENMRKNHLEGLRQKSASFTERLADGAIKFSQLVSGTYKPEEYVSTRDPAWGNMTQGR